MPLPHRLGRFNARVTNRLTGGPARLLPGFGLVVHRGRRSGREYRTPVNVFRHGDRYVLALTYGADASWVRNVRAGNGCDLVTRGRRVRLCSPTLEVDRTRRLVPIGVRQVLAVLRVDEFLTLERCPD